MHTISPAAAFGLIVMTTLLAPSTGHARPGIVPGTEVKGGAAPAQISSSSHKLLSTTVDYGDSGVTVQPYAFPVIDSNVVTCPKSTCTIVVDVTAELGGQTATGNQWAACAVVDGSTAPNGCPYNGELPIDGTYLTGSARQTFPVQHGSHTVGFELFVGSVAAIAAIYDVHYDVLTP